MVVLTIPPFKPKAVTPTRRPSCRISFSRHEPGTGLSHHPMAGRQEKVHDHMINWMNGLHCPNTSVPLTYY